MKNKLNQPDVEPTLTTFGESITINTTIPTKQFKDIFVTGTSTDIGKHIPTETEIKKIWRKLGYSWEEDIYCIKLTNLKKDKVIVFSFASKSYYCKSARGYIYESITFQEHQLLTKTFKMLGREV